MGASCGEGVVMLARLEGAALSGPWAACKPALFLCLALLFALPSLHLFGLNPVSLRRNHAHSLHILRVLICQCPLEWQEPVFVEAVQEDVVEMRWIDVVGEAVFVLLAVVAARTIIRMCPCLSVGPFEPARGWVLSVSAIPLRLAEARVKLPLFLPQDTDKQD